MWFVKFCIDKRRRRRLTVEGELGELGHHWFLVFDWSLCVHDDATLARYLLYLHKAQDNPDIDE